MNKKPKDYTQIQLKKKVRNRLKSMKVHPNQSYSEVINDLLNQLNLGQPRVPRSKK